MFFPSQSSSSFDSDDIVIAYKTRFTADGRVPFFKHKRHSPAPKSHERRTSSVSFEDSEDNEEEAALFVPKKRTSPPSNTYTGRPRAVGAEYKQYQPTPGPTVTPPIDRYIKSLKAYMPCLCIEDALVRAQADKMVAAMEELERRFGESERKWSR